MPTPIFGTLLIRLIALAAEAGIESANVSGLWTGHRKMIKILMGEDCQEDDLPAEFLDACNGAHHRFAITIALSGTIIIVSRRLRTLLLNMYAKPPDLSSLTLLIIPSDSMADDLSFLQISAPTLYSMLVPAKYSSKLLLQGQLRRHCSRSSAKA